MDEHARTAKSSQMCGRVLLRNELGSVLSPFRNAGQKGAELAFHHLSRLKNKIMNNQIIQIWTRLCWLITCTFCVGICSANPMALLSKLSSNANRAPWTPDSIRWLANSFKPMAATQRMTRSLVHTRTSRLSGSLSACLRLSSSRRRS